MVNWGHIASATSANASKNFASSYTTQSKVIAIGRRSDVIQYAFVNILAETKTNFSYQTGSSTGSINWLAVGY